MKNLLIPADFSWDAINWGRLVLAGVAGAVAWALASLLLGVNPVAYGAVLLPNASETMQAIAGGGTVVVACLLFALIWVLFFMPLKLWSYGVKLIFAALAITTLSHLFMPGEPALSVAATWIRFITFVVGLFVISLVYEGAPWKK